MKIIKINSARTYYVDRANSVIQAFNNQPPWPTIAIFMLKKTPGIYALYHNWKCVYIGISHGDIKSRLMAHFIREEKVFDSIKWVDSCPISELKTIEAILISSERPIYNKKIEVAPIDILKSVEVAKLNGLFSRMDDIKYDAI